MAKTSELNDWRQQRIDEGELDKTLAVAKEIRDDPNTPAKERVAAIVAISRLLGITGTARVGTTKAGGHVTNKTSKFTPDQLKEIERRLNSD